MFGAVVGDIQGVIPAVEIAVDQTLTPTIVQGHIDRFDGEVAFALGNLGALSAGQNTQVLAAGKRLVIDAAASVSIDSYFMLRDQPHAENGYGKRLWDRYEAGLKTLVASVQTMRDENGIGDDDGVPGRGAVALDLREPFFLAEQW